MNPNDLISKLIGTGSNIIDALGKGVADDFSGFQRGTRNLAETAITGFAPTHVVAKLQSGGSLVDALRSTYQTPIEAGLLDKQLEFMNKGQSTAQAKGNAQISNFGTFALGFISPDLEAFKGFKDLSTKVLERLKGKSITSKQEILDFTNMPDLKQAERDLIRKVVDENYGSGISKELEPLAQEARKYKSAEEFVKAAKARLQFHGTTPENAKSIMKGGFSGDMSFTPYYDEALEYTKGIGIDDAGYNRPSGVVPVIPTEGAKNIGVDGVDKLTGENIYAKEHVVAFNRNKSIESQLTDIYNQATKGSKIPVQEFANKVKTELLPLEAKNAVMEGATKVDRNTGRIMFGQPANYKYENITLSDELRGPVANYSERIYQSPIKTSAGGTHFSGLPDEEIGNYFAHTRIEDLPIVTIKNGQRYEDIVKAGTTRRVIELQSDLFQKGGLDKEMGEEFAKQSGSYGKPVISDKQFTQLEPYRNTWHERVIREEVKQAAIDGKTKLQFPTGETAMKIEGLGTGNQEWSITAPSKKYPDTYAEIEKLTPENMKVGQSVAWRDSGGDEMIITDVLGDGKFKAVPKDVFDKMDVHTANGATEQDVKNAFAETHDISGKVTIDTSLKGDPMVPTPENIKSIIGKLSDEMKKYPKKSHEWNVLDAHRNKAIIYRFYARDIADYIKLKFGAKQITDPQGVSWWELNVPKERARLPVEAFGVVPLLMNPNKKDKNQ